jgi:phage baseplate assembly protein gpV
MESIINKKQSKLLYLKFFISLFGFFLVLTSCQDVVVYSETIYDAQTKEPVDSVKCEMVAFDLDNLITYSDSLGNYRVKTPVIGCTPKCGRYDVEFSKQGYKTQIVKAPTNIFFVKE